jgi:hypothetical protein
VACSVEGRVFGSKTSSLFLHLTAKAETVPSVAVNPDSFAVSWFAKSVEVVISPVTLVLSLSCHPHLFNCSLTLATVQPDSVREYIFGGKKTKITSVSVFNGNACLAFLFFCHAGLATTSKSPVHVAPRDNNLEHADF